jgi:hypothetical protein
VTVVNPSATHAPLVSSADRSGDVLRIAGTTAFVPLAKSGHLVVRVYDVRGALLAELCNSEVAAGTHRFNLGSIWTVSGLQGTVLVVASVDGKRTATKSLIVSH